MLPPGPWSPGEAAGGYVSLMVADLWTQSLDFFSAPELSKKEQAGRHNTMEEEGLTETPGKCFSAEAGVGK